MHNEYTHTTTLINSIMLCKNTKKMSIKKKLGTEIEHLSLGGASHVQMSLKNSLIPDYWFLTIIIAGDCPIRCSRVGIYSKGRRSVKYPVNW